MVSSGWTSKSNKPNPFVKRNFSLSRYLATLETTVNRYKKLQVPNWFDGFRILDFKQESLQEFFLV